MSFTFVSSSLPILLNHEKHPIHFASLLDRLYAMAPSLEETSNGHAPADTPIDTPVEAPFSETNVHGSSQNDTPAVVNTAGAAAHVRSAGPPIPGPLGIESASLKGKVALVTGAGISSLRSNSHCQRC